MFTNLARSVGHLYLSSLSPSEQVLNSFKEEMALKNVILQSSKRENIGSTSEGTANASIAYTNRSTKVMTKSMTKAAAFITSKEQVVAPTLQSRKTQKIGSNLPFDGVN